MIPVHLYFYTYIFICIILILQYKQQTSVYLSGILTKENNNSNYVKIWIIGFFFILFFGLRETENDPHLYMADTGGYARYYNAVKNGYIKPFLWLIGNGSVSSEYVFLWIRDIMATKGYSVHLWFIVVATIYIVPKLLIVKRWFPQNTYLAMLFVITAMGFYSGGTNGIRNADASSLVILGISYIIARQKKIKDYLIGILLFAMAYYTHHSVIISIAALVASFFVVRNTKFAIIIWFFAVLMSLIMGNTLANFGAALFDDDRATSYLASGANDEVMAGFSHTGFRWDFLLYSSMPILMGWYVLIRRGIIDTTYKLLVNTYILANSVWVVFIYASFNNRYAALSWAMYSYVLLYPLVRYNLWGEKQPYYTSLILIGQLVFISII